MKIPMTQEREGWPQRLEIDTISRQSEVIVAPSVSVFLTRNAYVSKGLNPVATTADRMLLSGMMYELAGVQPGEKLAFLAVGGTGVAKISGTAAIPDAAPVPPPPPPPPPPPAGPEYVVVLSAGQSNMVGTDTLTPYYTYDSVNDPTDARILQWTYDATNYPAAANTLVLAQDPLNHPGVANVNRAVGPSMAFARALLPTLQASQKIVIVPTAVGGTGLINDRWSGTMPGDLYTSARNALANVLTTLNTATPGSAECQYILWWQGENDMFYNRDAEQYKVQFDAVVDGFRSVSGAASASMLICGVVQEYFQGDATKTAIQTALANTPLRKPRTYFVPPPTGSFTSGDVWHASTPAQRTIGANLAALRDAPALHTTTIPATPTVTLEGEVVKITPNGSPAYLIESRAAGSSGAYTETLVYPHKHAAAAIYTVLPGAGARECRVRARSIAGDSAPTSTMTYAVPTASVPQAYWDHDYAASTYDGGGVLTSLVNNGTNAGAWTPLNSPNSVTINGVTALNVTGGTQAIKVTGALPAGDYTVIGAYYEGHSSAGEMILGPGEVTANYGVIFRRTPSDTTGRGVVRASHNNGAITATQAFDIKASGYVCAALVYVAATQTFTVYVNGCVYATGTTVTRTTAPSTKAWNDLADNRADAFLGAKLAWKAWSSALTADQVRKVAHDIRTQYGIEWTT